MLCQVISPEWAFFSGGRGLSVKALSTTETNKCVQCFAVALRASIYAAAEWLDLVLVQNTEGIGQNRL